jgi:UDP-3-O-[3-hydroxymyristoyl] glucosamine N-acyltransferase
MEHPGFFHRAGPFTLRALAEATGAVLDTQDDPEQQVSDVAPLDCAGAADVSFFDNAKYLAQFEQTKAGACFVGPKFAARRPAGVAGLTTPEPYRAYAKALWRFYPEAGHPKTARATTACGADGAGAAGLIDSSAMIEDGVVIEPGVIIGPEASIGRGTHLAAGAVIGYRCAIGRDCYVGPRAVITHALIGNRVIIHAGAALGQDGFGFAMGRQGHFKVPQIGRVVIQDDVEIGANTTIDRGALRDTVIGEGAKIDNLVQIAHNVMIGRCCVIVSQTGVSGSTVLEDFVVAGGQSGFAGHLRIGAGAQIAGAAGVASDIPRGERWSGIPARPLRVFAREVALVKRLAEKISGKDLKNVKLGLD